MAEKKSRFINTAFWSDDWVLQLDPLEKMLFMYFLTNPMTDICGVYQISLKRVAFDTGIEQEMVKKLINRFSADGKLHFELGWIIIKNWIKHQTLTSAQLVKGIENSLNRLPESLREHILIDDTHTLYIPLDKICIDYEVSKVKESKRIVIESKVKKLKRPGDWKN